MISIQIRAMLPEDAVAVNLLAAQLGYPHPIAETTDRIKLMLEKEKRLSACRR